MNDIDLRIKRLTEVCREEERILAAFALKIFSTYGVRVEKDDIEDILSDAYLKATTRLLNNKNLEIQNYQGWIRRFISFTCLSFLKKKLKTSDHFVQLGRYDHVYELIQEDAYDHSIYKELVDELLKRLPQLEQEVIKLSIIEGYSTKDIAEKIKKQTDNVRQIKHRALLKLREYLGGENE